LQHQYVNDIITHASHNLQTSKKSFNRQMLGTSLYTRTVLK